MRANERRATRVIVVAEVRLYREGLAQALNETGDLEVVGITNDWSSVCESAKQLRPEVIVVDTAIKNALATFREIAAFTPRPRVVALGVNEDEDDIAACAAAGVSGFVAREASFDELVRTIAAVTRGEAACSAPIIANLLHRVAALAPSHFESDPSLTSREREVLALIAQDLSNKEIAFRLSVDVSTVKNHVHNLLDKMRVHRRSEAAARLRQRPSDIQIV